MKPEVFFTAFKSAHHFSLSWARLIQSIPPHPTSWIYILILSSHLRLGLPNRLLSGFPTKTLHTHFPFPIRATCPAHLILLYFIIRTILGEQYRSLSSSVCSFLQSPVNSSLLGPNILLNNLFSKMSYQLGSYQQPLRWWDDVKCWWGRRDGDDNTHSWVRRDVFVFTADPHIKTSYGAITSYQMDSIYNSFKTTWPWHLSLDRLHLKFTYSAKLSDFVLQVECELCAF
jgi:hypothetical protein